MVAKPNFWDDSESAGHISQALADLKEEHMFWDGISDSVTYLREVADLPDIDEELEKEVETKTKELEKNLDAIELRMFFGGPHDKESVYLTVRAGAGGVDAQDWASMLVRMYQRYGERKNYKVHLIEESKGEEAGIKRAVLEIDGPYAYGYLRGEHGVHRLVRISPFSAQKLRHTSFAMVEVIPKMPELSKEIDIAPENLEMDTFRASGPGGQNVNKVSSAVRIKHIPSGITVSVQSGRSQGDNRAKALEIIKAKLYIERLKKREQELRGLKGNMGAAEWGNQIRSYVLHPYQMVKDTRSNYETRAVEDVLDGDLDAMIESEIRTREITTSA